MYCVIAETFVISFYSKNNLVFHSTAKAIKMIIITVGIQSIDRAVASKHCNTTTIIITMEIQLIERPSC